MTVDHVTPQRRVGLPSTDRWHPTVGILRFVCLPARVLEEVQFADSTAAMDKLRHIRQGLAGAMVALADELGTRVPGEEDQRRRRALINARRSLHRQRSPAERDVQVLMEVDEDLAESLQKAMTQLETCTALEAELPGTLQREYRQRQQILKEQVGASRDFLSALALVAPDLMESLGLYLRAPQADTLTQWRKLELTLATYWSRAATKTSPMSRLTYTAVVDWSAAAVGPQWQASVQPGSLRSNMQLHRGVVRDLCEGVTSMPTLLDAWTWVVHPQLERGATTWTLRHRLRGSERRARHITLPVTPVLRAVAARLTASPQRLPDLINTLVPDGGPVAARVKTYLEELIRLGILIPQPQLSDNSADPLGTLVRRLQVMDHPEASSLVVALQELLDGLARCSELDHVERRGAIQVIRRQVQGLLRQLNRPEVLPSRLMYEDAGVGVDEVQLSESPHGETPWNAVAALAFLCAPVTLERLETIERFVKQFGVGAACTQPLAFLQPDTTNLSSGQSDRDQAYLQELDALRLSHRQAVHALLQQVSALQATGASEVTLDAQWVCDLAAQSRAPWSSRAMTLLLQPLPGGDLVVNGVLPGHGLLLSRQQALAPDGDAQALVKKAYEAVGGLYGQARGAHVVPVTDSTINAFPTPLDSVLRTPDDAATQPSDLRVQDCTIQHDPEGHQLVVRDIDDQAVTPLYLGAFEPAFLTPVEQAIVQLAPNITCSLDIPGLLRRRQGPVELAWPRVRMGQIILSRRTWMISQDTLCRGAQETEHRYWERLRAWAQDQELPLQFFGLPDAQWREQAQSLGDMTNRTARLKPQYFDLDNFFLVRLFERWVSDAGQVWAWQEALPAPGQAGVKLAGEIHVAELGIELHYSSSQD